MNENSYLYFAEKDYKLMCLSYEYNLDYDSTVVLCQQFLEKALMHLCELKLGEQFKTHKLTSLSGKLKIDELDKYENELRKIQDYYFDKRYPNEDYVQTSKEECERTVETTKEIREIIEKECNKYATRKGKQMTIFDSVE